MTRSIAIDGPCGAGKSTFAKRLAEELGFRYVDTGAIYRTVGLFLLREGVDSEDPAAVEEQLGRVEVRLTYGEDGLQRMFLNGKDVTGAIRENAVSDYSSKVSAIPAVRAFLLEMQRKAAREQDVIMDGRDIGTVVLPNADVKIFLTASAEDRAERRYRELVERGEQVDRAEILREVRARDDRDINRAVAPLRQAQDAVVVDTTGAGLEESFQMMLDAISDKLGLRGSEE